MLSSLKSNVPPNDPAPAAADVCLIVEGAYPYVAGGVSSWVDGLIRRHNQLRFSVVAILPESPLPVSKYPAPANLVDLHHLYLSETGGRGGGARPGGLNGAELSAAVDDFLRNGSLAGLDKINTMVAPLLRTGQLASLLNSSFAWEVVCDVYQRTMPHESFLHFFWGWRALFGGLIATLGFALPSARVYHAVSTGYAGLLAARAAVETGRPVLLTEHGIYTNERRIEILQADWIVDTIDKGFSIRDTRRDLRDFWVSAFESFARTCYEASVEVITLHEANRLAQITFGADPKRTKIIPNGVNYEALSRLRQAADDTVLTVALVGRVVPIKDISTFLQAIHFLRDRFPLMRAVVLGATDEQPDYYVACKAAVEKLGLGSMVRFAGNVDVMQHFPYIHVNVLTSLSESQPLTLLEAGAAGIPSVATDVGSCREILLGRKDEAPALGPGGILTDVASPRETAEAIATLLSDPALRQSLGCNMQKRVRDYYDLKIVDDAYRAIYDKHTNAASRQMV